MTFEKNATGKIENHELRYNRIGSWDGSTLRSPQVLVFSFVILHCLIVHYPMLSCYLATQHDKQQEDLAARALARSLKLALPPDEAASIVFNLRAYRLQFDAVLLSPRTLTVIDWKDTQGAITGDENNKWKRDDGSDVVAGTFINPFQQILAARRTLAKYIKDHRADIFEDGGARFDSFALEQVSASILFTPRRPELNLNLPRSARSWLLITGLDVAATELTALHSKLTLKPSEIQTLIDHHWKCPRWTEVETLLPDQPVGTLWEVNDKGERKGFAIVRAATIGRTAECDVQVAAGGINVSRVHAQLHVAGAKVVLYDLASKNGTYIEGTRLEPHQPYVLSDGQNITLGGPPSAQDVARLQFKLNDNNTLPALPTHTHDIEKPLNADDTEHR